MPADERVAYAALALTPGLSAPRLHALYQVFGSWSGALSAPFAFLCTVPGLSRAAATAVCGAGREAAERALSQAERLGARVLLPEEPGFPECLRVIPDPPGLLFALGDLTLLHPPAVAVVGSRSHTCYGADVARLVAGGAASAGLVVVSGMARGLDALAHLAALDANAPTIGILGNGLGVVYPAANQELYQRVTEKGLLLTEHPPGERPRTWTFPRRNRLISGLARVTVVVEASMKSGALITAGCALDQGKEVMAVPGPITSPSSAGANRLIRDGAGPLLELADLLAHYPEARPVSDATPAPVRPGMALQPLERRVLAALDEVPRSLDAVAQCLALSPAQLLGVLCHLELAGAVEQEVGMRFRRA